MSKKISAERGRKEALCIWRCHRLRMACDSLTQQLKKQDHIGRLLVHTHRKDWSYRLLRREFFLPLKEDDGSNEIFIICFLVSYSAVRNKKANEKKDNILCNIQCIKVRISSDIYKQLQELDMHKSVKIQEMLQGPTNL